MDKGAAILLLEELIRSPIKNHRCIVILELYTYEGHFVTKITTSRLDAAIDFLEDHLKAQRVTLTIT